MLYNINRGITRRRRPGQGPEGVADPVPASRILPVAALPPVTAAPPPPKPAFPPFTHSGTAVVPRDRHTCKQGFPHERSAGACRIDCSPGRAAACALRTNIRKKLRPVCTRQGGVLPNVCDSAPRGFRVPKRRFPGGLPPVSISADRLVDAWDQGFPGGFRSLKQGVSEGFPRVSEGFRIFMST